MNFKTYGELMDNYIEQAQKIQEMMQDHKPSDHGNSAYKQLSNELDDIYAAGRVMRRAMFNMLDASELMLSDKLKGGK